MAATAMRGVPVALLPAGTTTGTGTAICLQTSFQNCRIHLRGSAGIASGNIIIEEASDPAFSGTWSQLLSVAATTILSSEQVLHVLGSMGAIRARISVAVVGGTVGVDLVAA